MRKFNVIFRVVKRGSFVEYVVETIDAYTKPLIGDLIDGKKVYYAEEI